MGQTILTLASIVLLAIISMSIRQMYVQSVYTTVDSQEQADALNFGRDFAEELHSYAFGTRYDQLDAVFGNLNDVSDPATRREFISQIDGTLYATVELFPEETMIHGQIGRKAIIVIYKEEKDDDYKKLAEYKTAISPIDIN